jgi:enamine deaminase RidA (YjgF/YER057c/UK114 family)
VPKAGLSHDVVSSSRPKPLANYSEAFTVSNFIFAACHLASDFSTGIAPEARRNNAFPYYGSDIKLQTTYIMEGLKQIFEAAGGGLD